MWISLASAVLAAAFLWLTVQLLRHSREVGVELSIHRRARLSRRLQNLVLGCAAVGMAALALQAGVLLHALDAPVPPVDITRKPVTLRFDSQLRLVPTPATPTIASVDDIALTGAAR